MSGLLADPGSSQDRPNRRVKLGSGAPESLRAETRAAWSEPHSGQAVPGSAAGWQCAIQDHDSLLISTVGVPTGVEWKLEVQDERWDRPFFTKCTEPNTALRLGRGTKYSPAPTEPVRVRMRLGLVSASAAVGGAGGKDAGWSEWVTLAADGGPTQFVPLGFEEMRPAFDRFNKGRAPAGHATYKELQSMLRSVGVDPTTKAAATALAAHQVDPKDGSAVMAAAEFATLVTQLRRVQLAEQARYLVITPCSCVACGWPSRRRRTLTLTVTLEP